MVCVALAAALVTALAACTAEQPSITGNLGTTQAAGQSNAARVAQLSLSPEEVAQQGPTVPFSPFNDPTTSAVGGREVIANPTRAQVLEPGPLPEIAFGSADAPVTLVQYASLTCPYCKKFHAEVYPTLKRDYIDTGKVRYILRDFPIGRTSGQASVALRCAKPEVYLDLYARFLDTQPTWVSQEVRLDPIAAVAAKAGVTRDQFDACRSDVALVEGIKATKDRGRKLGIIGTPNFFVQDKLIKKTLDMAELRALIDPLVSARTAAAAPANP